MSESSRVPLLVQQGQQDSPGLETGPVQPLVGAVPVVEVSSGHTGGGTQQAGNAAQVSMTGEGGEVKESINLKGT